jgi:FAD:protein FMN transferase
LDVFLAGTGPSACERSESGGIRRSPRAVGRITQTKFTSILVLIYQFRFLLTAAAKHLAVLSCLLLTGCGTVRPETHLRRCEFKGPAMGTLFTITLFASDTNQAPSAAEAAFKRISDLEDIMSDYQADSELMRLCDQPPGKPVHVSGDLFDVLQKAQEIARRSDGAFDITVGPYVRLWRFARKRKVLSSREQMAQVRNAVGWQKLRLDPKNQTATLLVPGMRLDLGGIAKGYAADQAIDVLRKRGISRALVAASGDIAIGDSPPGEDGWKIGITDIDEHSNRISRSAYLHNCGVSTSGDTEQFLEIGGIRYSHILDPHTGIGLTNRVQATVIAPNATASDALATTVCVLGPRDGLRLVNSLPRTGVLVLVKEGSQSRSFVSPRFRKLTKTCE